MKTMVADRDDSGGIRRGRPGVRGLDRSVRFTALGETGNAEEYSTKRTKAVHRWQSGVYMKTKEGGNG